MVLSLVELCVRSAIDNLSHLGDVGHTDMSLLEVILPHCDADQLLHIESSTEGRDLSPITDELWLKCYSRKFGNDAVEMVKRRMADRKCKFKWKQLYQAKIKEQEEVQRKGVDRLKELYKEAKSLKATRQTRSCEITPPDTKRSKCGPGSGRGSAPVGRFANCKGRLMKKARMEYVNSNEAKMHAAMRRKPVVASARPVPKPILPHQPPRIGHSLKK